jgi:hypothetical protein
VLSRDSAQAPLGVPHPLATVFARPLRAIRALRPPIATMQMGPFSPGGWRMPDKRNTVGFVWPDSEPKPSSGPLDGLKEFRAAKEAELRTAEIRAGMAKPRSQRAHPSDIVLEVATANDTTAQLECLVEPYLPARQVVGFYGRGGTAKSSFVATLAAQVGQAGYGASTLWISTEEDLSWIKVRHVKAGGGEGTLYVVKAIATSFDAAGHPTASMFNIHEHLEAAIIKARTETATNASRFIDGRERPLRLVVLDTAVALTTWAKGESPNDDASVKRLIAFLYGLCERYSLTIALIGHINKGRHDYLADMVAGSGSWTSSLRQAFMHMHDQRAEYNYVLCTVKDTLTGPFACEYRTYPVHTLAQRADGSDSVLCAVLSQPIQWGYRNVRSLIASATARDDDDDAAAGATNQKWKQIGAVVTTVLQMLDSGVQPVTRKAVHETLRSSVSPRHWQEADNMLAIAHHVVGVPGPRGERMYQRKHKE